MPPHVPITLLETIEELGPDPFMRCRCLECLEVIEAWMDGGCYAREIAA